MCMCIFFIKRRRPKNITMSHQTLVYKKDYNAVKKPQKWTGSERVCPGYYLTIDGYGYTVISCYNIIKENSDAYFKSECECIESANKPYCSIECAWHKCVACDRLICAECYRYRDNSCVYCKHLGDHCECSPDEYLCVLSSSSSSSSTESSEEEEVVKEEIVLNRKLKILAEKLSREAAENKSLIDECNRLLKKHRRS